MPSNTLFDAVGDAGRGCNEHAPPTGRCAYRFSAAPVRMMNRIVHSRQRAPRVVIALTVTMALLFAQWLGLAHRISHAQLQWQQLFSAASQSGDSGDLGIHHSCAAFDAATIGDTVHLPPFIAPLLTGVRVLAAWTAFASWDAPLVRWFSSRAPPLC